MENQKHQALSIIVLFLLASTGIFYLEGTTQNYLDLVKTTLSFALKARGIIFKEVSEELGEVIVLFLVDNSESPREVKLFTGVSLNLIVGRSMKVGYYSYNHTIPGGTVILGKWSFTLTNSTEIETFKGLVENQTPVQLKMTVSAILLDFKKMLFVDKKEEVQICYG
ncbi:MAG: hypothetical protein QXJ27_06510 [Thermoplasmata archaeon]